MLIGPHPALRLLLDAFPLHNTLSFLCCLVIDLVPSLIFELSLSVLSLSQRFKSGDFVFMQDNASCSAHRSKATNDDPRNVVPNFAVEKTSESIAAVTMTNQDEDQFSTFLVERLLRLLVTLFFAC